eukprot:Gb_41259 [translate_table: standard]
MLIRIGLSRICCRPVVDVEDTNLSSVSSKILRSERVALAGNPPTGFRRVLHGYNFGYLKCCREFKVLATFHALVLNGGKHTVSLNEDLYAFYAALARGLDNLESSLSTNFISFQWLKEALDLLKYVHSAVILMVDKLNLSVSLRGEGWLNEYMDETVKLLDVCNVLKAGLSGLKGYQMLVELALRKLNVTGNVTPMSFMAIHTLDTCKDEVESLEAKNKKILQSKKLTDGRLNFFLNEKHLESKFVKWNGVWGVMFAMKKVTSLISWLLISALVYSGSLDVHLKFDCKSFQSQWSASFAHLYDRFLVELGKNCDGNRGSVLLLHELETLESIITDFRDKVQLSDVGNLGTLGGDCDDIQQSIQLLKEKSTAFKESPETVNWLVNDLFNEIVQGRNKLLQVFSDTT